MRTSLTWGAWITLTANTRLRSAQLGWMRGWVTVHNDSSGGWRLEAVVEGEPSRAYVPGRVTWREAERCAARYLRRLMSVTSRGGTA